MNKQAKFENKASTYEKDGLVIWTGRMFKARVANPSLLGYGYHEGLTVYVNEKKVTVDGETDHFFEVDHKERRAPRRLSPERAKAALQTVGWLTDAEYAAVLEARSR